MSEAPKRTPALIGLEWTIEELAKLVGKPWHGTVTLEFQDGVIVHLKKTESLLPPYRGNPRPPAPKG